MRLNSVKRCASSSRTSDCACSASHRPFELHRSCHDLNAGDPHVRSHRTTASFEIVGSPSSIAAHRRSSSATSSADSTSAEVASVAISARRSGTDSLRSAALASDCGPFVDFDEAFRSVHRGKVTPVLSNINTCPQPLGVRRAWFHLIITFRRSSRPLGNSAGTGRKSSRPVSCPAAIFRLLIQPRKIQLAAPCEAPLGGP